MTCYKCKGLMVRERIDDLAGGTSAYGWRCVNCGNILCGTPLPLAPPTKRVEGGKTGATETPARPSGTGNNGVRRASSAPSLALKPPTPPMPRIDESVEAAPVEARQERIIDPPTPSSHSTHGHYRRGFKFDPSRYCTERVRGGGTCATRRLFGLAICWRHQQLRQLKRKQVAA